MKRETKVVIIGVIRLSIAIGLGILSLMAGQTGWACIMFVVAIFMGIDSYRSYKDENYDHTSSSDDHDRTDDRD